MLFQYFRLLLLILFLPIPVIGSQISINQLTCNEKVSPSNVSSVFLGWRITANDPDFSQSAWQIEVGTDSLQLRSSFSDSLSWNSGKVESSQSGWITYEGEKMESDQTYYWRVRIWDENGEKSEWSKISSWHTGLLNSYDWEKAEWIGWKQLPDSCRIVPGVHGSGKGLGNKAINRAVNPLFRRAFTIEKPVVSANLYLSGIGQYQIWTNGKQCDPGGFLSPAWSNYDKTLYFNAYDLTGFIHLGENVVGVKLASGFAYINRERYRKLVTAFCNPEMIAVLRLKFADGTERAIYSGTDWEMHSSATVYSGIYGGEDYNACLSENGWNNTGYSSADWETSKVVKAPKGKLMAESDFPVMIMDTIFPKKLISLSDSVCVIDFGQNASGIPKICVNGKKGQQLRLIPGELLAADSTVNQKATGSPYFYNYRLGLQPTEFWQPEFSYYGFRYLQINGINVTGKRMDLPQLQSVVFLHTRNSSPETGTFHCSNELFNQIFQLIRWAIRSNMQSVLTDCPHRERLGWLEQTYLMGSGIHYNYQIHMLYRKIIRDMQDAQYPNGLVPSIVPEYVRFGGDFTDSPEWGSAAVQLPWLLYKWYADSDAVRQAFPMMVKYINYLKSKSQKNLLTYGLGDWYDLGPKHPGYAQLTPKTVTATAIYFDDLSKMEQLCGLLKKDSLQSVYRILKQKVQTAFNQQFYNADTKVYATGSQTAMAMPLCVGLVPEKDREKVLKNLVDSVLKNDKALTAGDIGFHYLIKALEDNGQGELIYEMNNRNDVPGYGYQLKKGATSLTESWQALRGVSNNHLMLGHLMEWFYAGLGGIRQTKESVAYRHLLLSPQIPGGLSEVEVSYLSPKGEIRSNWKNSSETFNWKLLIPAGVDAKVIIPFWGKLTVNRKTSKGKWINFYVKNDLFQNEIELPGGNYRIQVEKKKSE